jgi:UDPglucose--hexose-1-phosphate uridylyltransferase
VEFRRELLTAEFLDPGRDFERASCDVEVRWDPLTGHTSRLVPARGLMPSSDFDLESFARETAERCPFCGDRLSRLTPKLCPEISPEGRISVGEAVLFPNLHAYGQHSSVSVYSPDLHYLPLEHMTDRLVADNLAAQVTFDAAVMASDPNMRWASISANHMLPSGSSLFHPHLQGSVDPVPTTFQRLLADVPGARFDACVEAERRAGERYLGSTGRVDWMASFAPVAPGELRAFVAGVASPVELDAELIEELGQGIAVALRFYAELGFESFNMAIYGAPVGTAGYRLNLRIACRSNLQPMYRSDATYLERLHWEAAVDLWPEEVAEMAGDRFRR